MPAGRLYSGVVVQTKKPEQPKYDYRTKNKICARIAAMPDDQLIIRECNRSVKRSTLIKDWGLAGSASKQHLLVHLDECIRLTEFELKIIHEVMHRRGLKVWDESFMQEDEEK
ncbi:MAG: hypothetical protein M0R51_05150 [Clostridia bacterium]|nr:hypothetical protein [Clostridia bacterium]